MSRVFVLNWSTSPPLAVAAVTSNSTDPRFWRLTTTLTRPSTWPSGTRFTTNNSLLPRLSGKNWHFKWNYFFLNLISFSLKVWKWHLWPCCHTLDVIHRTSTPDSIQLTPCTRRAVGTRAQSFTQVSTKTKRNYNSSSSFRINSASFSLLFLSPMCSTRAPWHSRHSKQVKSFFIN